MKILIPAVVFGSSLIPLAYLLLQHLRIHRVGGIHFWRWGRIGGSFYVATRTREG